MGTQKWHYLSGATITWSLKWQPYKLNETPYLKTTCIKSTLFRGHMLRACTSSTTYTWQWHYHNDSWRNSTYRAAWPDKVELWRWVWSLCSSYGMLQRNLCEFSWLLHEHSHWGAFHEHILWFVNNQNWGLCKTRLYEWRCSHSWQFMNGHELSWMTFMTIGRPGQDQRTFNWLVT